MSTVMQQMGPLVAQMFGRAPGTARRQDSVGNSDSGERSTAPPASSPRPAAAPAGDRLPALLAPLPAGDGCTSTVPST